MKSKLMVALLVASATLSSFLPVTASAGQRCTGNACADIQHSWDAGAQRHLFTNLGSRRVKVELRNWAAGNTLTLVPGQSTYAGLQMFEVPFRANYD